MAIGAPHKLVVELAKDSQLFTLVPDKKNMQDAIKWYLLWGIDTSRANFIVAKQGEDAWWVRDWGPHAVFTPHGRMELGDGKYIYSTPMSGLACDDSLRFLYKTADNKIIRTDIDDQATLEIGKALNIPVLDLPFISTGGNVLTDGLGTAFSTCILANENRFNGTPAEIFFALNKQLLGINNYHLVSNFSKGDIQHIDCFMTLLDEERILVAEPPAGNELHQVYENIVTNELSKLRTVFGRPFQILRIKIYPYRLRFNKEELLTAYTNSLILNKTIYVPLFGIPGDSIALKRWSEVMPGYRVKGFEFTLKDEPFLNDKAKKHYGFSTIGWGYDDALHCRTRAIWDTIMLYMAVKTIDQNASPGGTRRVFVTIIDYSKKGLIAQRTNLYWRLRGESNWNEIGLQSTEDGTHFFADIPFNRSKNQIEYYVSATSKSGRTEVMPRTAPKGFYSFSIY
jgi:agmatine/peptidylarginine deiminase